MCTCLACDTVLVLEPWSIKSHDMRSSETSISPKLSFLKCQKTSLGPQLGSLHHMT